MILIQTVLGTVIKYLLKIQCYPIDVSGDTPRYEDWAYSYSVADYTAKM